MDTCVDICIDMCVGICVEMYVDMWPRYVLGANIDEGLRLAVNDAFTKRPHQAFFWYFLVALIKK